MAYGVRVQGMIVGTRSDNCAVGNGIWDLAAYGDWGAVQKATMPSIVFTIHGVRQTFLIRQTLH